MRRAALALILFAAACQFDPPSQGARDPDTPLISAEGYGPVRIGMTIDEASAALNAPLSPDMPFDEPELCQTLHIGPPNPPNVVSHSGLSFMAQHGKITRVSLYGDTIPGSTASRLGVGSTDAEIRAASPDVVEHPAAYADPPAHDLVVWEVPGQSGVRFEIDAEGRATALHAGDDTILYIEGCL